jgi:endonuclease/exonuclease/phosphatase (EEP) superfamily protein YafD
VSAPQQPVSPVRLALVRGLRAALWLLGAASLIGLLARESWRAELVTHFRDYFTWSACLGLLAALGLGQRRLVPAALAIALLNAWWVVPPMLAAPPAAAAPGAPLRLLNLNVWRDNPDRERAVRYLAASRADLILVQEIHSPWARALSKGLGRAYEPVLVEPRDEHHFGIGLYLRRGGPLRAEHAALFYPDDSRGHPAIAATLRHAAQRIEFLGVHVHPPLHAYVSLQRRMQLGSMANWLAVRRGPRLLLGDTNATVYSPLFQDLLRDSGLADARTGFGLPYSWFPAPWLPFGLAIDTCLHSPDFVTRGVRRGPAVGSDHRPLHVDLELRSR